MVNNKTIFGVIKKTQHIIISIIIYLLLAQFIQTLMPRNILNGYLSSHTVVCILYLLAIYYISLFYNPPTDIIISLKTIIYSLLGIILCLIINLPYDILIKAHIKPIEYYFFISYGSVGKLYFLLLLVIIGPFVEEFYFRRYIYNIIKNEFNIVTAMFVSAFLYMVFHYYRIHLLYLFLPGLIYAFLYENTKTIWSSVIVHAMNNLVWFLLVYYA